VPEAPEESVENGQPVRGTDRGNRRAADKDIKVGRMIRVGASGEPWA